MVLRLLRAKERQFDPARFQRARRPRAFEPPRAVARRARVVRADEGTWPVFEVHPPSGVPSGVLLYVHGGAFAAEIGAGHWQLVARLAQRTGRTVVVPIYPLTPDHGHRDVLPTLHSLYQRIATTRGPVAVAGDSAGAAIVTVLVQTLPPEVRRPDNVVLLSPMLDATISDPAAVALEPLDPLLTIEHLRVLAAQYAAPDDPSVPQVSPINGPLDRLGTVDVFTGTRDVLNPDAHRLARLASGPGSRITLREYDGMVHDWMLMPVPEAAAAVDEIVDVLDQHRTGAAAATPPQRPIP